MDMRLIFTSDYEIESQSFNLSQNYLTYFLFIWKNYLLIKNMINFTVWMNTDSKSALNNF